MSSEQLHDRRQKAQERLTEAQDNWIAAIEKHGVDLKNQAVRAARGQLEKARSEYLSISSKKAGRG
jgi:hypothetical protein